MLLMIESFDLLKHVYLSLQMLISSPEFLLIELDLVSDPSSGRSFSVPSPSEKRISHPFQNRVQQVRQGIQLICEPGI